MANELLRCGARLGIIVRKLNRGISVRFACFYLGHDTWTSLNHGHGNIAPIFHEPASHSNFFSENCDWHCVVRFLRLNFYKHACGNNQTVERVDRAWIDIGDVDDALVRANFKLLAAFLVDEG